MMKKTGRLSIALLAGIITQNASATEINIGGFLNTIGSYTDAEVAYLEAEIDDNGSFQDSTFGIVLNGDIGEGTTIAAQLSTHSGSHDIEWDWGFATFDVSDSLDVRAGRLKFGNNLVTEYINVGHAYPWIRPPQEIYGESMLAPTMGLQNIDGVALDFSGDVGDSEYVITLYTGGTQIHGEMEMSYNKMYGFVGRLNTDVNNFIISFNHSLMGTDTNEMMGIFNDKNMDLFNVGWNMDWNNIQLWTEYTVSKSGFEDTMMCGGMMAACEGTLEIASHYATLAYRVADKWLPHITFSSLEHVGGLEQTTKSFGLRYDVTDSAALKIEWAQITPEAAGLPGTMRADNIPMMFGPEITVAGPMLGMGGFSGLFTDGNPAEDKVNMFSVALNYIF